MVLCPGAIKNCIHPYCWFRDNLKVFASCETSLTTIQSKPDSKMHAAIRQLLQWADFGIADFVVDDKPHLNVNMLYHPSPDVSVSIPIEEESSGLKRLFALAIPWIETLRQGCSHLYPLLDYSPRKDEALAKGYLLGRYGAIPFLSEPQWGEPQHVEA